jgi:hypothetical protein
MKKKHSQIFDSTDLMLLLTQALLREIAPDLDVPRFTAKVSVNYDQTPEGFVVRYNREGLLCEALVHAGELDVVASDIGLWLEHPEAPALLQRALLRRTQPTLYAPPMRGAGPATADALEIVRPPLVPPAITYEEVGPDAPEDALYVETSAPQAESEFKAWVDEYLGFYKGKIGLSEHVDAVRSVQLLADVLLAHILCPLVELESPYTANVPDGLDEVQLKGFYSELIRASDGDLKGVSLERALPTEALADYVASMYPGNGEDSPLWRVLDQALYNEIAVLGESAPSTESYTDEPPVNNGLPIGAYSNPKFQSVLSDLQKRDREDEDMSPTSFDPSEYARAAENAAKRAKTRKRNAEMVEASLRKFPDIKDLIGSLPLKVVRKDT